MIIHKFKDDMNPFESKTLCNIILDVGQVSRRDENVSCKTCLKILAKGIEEFKIKTVLFPVEVPPDIYCWKFGYVKDEMTVCGYYDNKGGHGCCLLHLGEIKETDLEGMLKPNKCLNLKEK